MNTILKMFPHKSLCKLGFDVLLSRTFKDVKKSSSMKIKIVKKKNSKNVLKK